MDPTTSPEDLARAAAMREAGRESSQCASDPALRAYEEIPAVEIDNGKFKYVLIEVHHPVTGEPKHLVRGKLGKSYHAGVAEETLKSLRRAGLRYDVLGGGRIEHNLAAKTIFIYGHSYGFPWQDGVFQHELSARVCAQAYPTHQISTSNEGY